MRTPTKEMDTPSLKVHKSKQYETYKLGLKAYKNKQYKEAILHFKQLAEEKQDNEAYFWLGNAYLANKNYDMAFHNLEMAQQYKPTGKEIWCNKHLNYKADSFFCMAKIASHQGDMTIAMNYIQDAVFLDNKNPQYHALRASFYVAQGKFQDAISSWKSAIAICDAALEQNYNLASLQKYTSLAIRYHLKLVDMLKQSQPSKKERVLHHETLARSYYELARLQPEKKVDYLLKTVRLLEKMDRLQKALDIWESMFTNDDMTSELCYEASRVCDKRIKQIEHSGLIKTEVQRSEITRLSELEQDYLQAAIRLANVETDNQQECIRNRLAQIFYRNVSTINENVLPRKTRLLRYKNYLNDHPNHKDGLYYLGNLYYLEEERGEAIIQFLKVLKIDPNHKPALNSLFDTIKTLKKEDDLSQVDMNVLYEVIKTYPKQYKSWLANKLLSEDSPPGSYFLASEAADKDKIHELIHMIPAGKKRDVWLEKACKANREGSQTALYTIVHRPRPDKSRLSGSVKKTLNQEYAESIKYKTFAAHSVDPTVQDYVKLNIMSLELTKHFDPGMLGQILRQFYNLAASKLASPGLPSISLPIYQQLVAQYSFEEILMAIHAPAIPGAENGKSVVTKEILLLSCLTENTLLGNKFLVNGNKRNLQKVLNALPETEEDAISQKIAILDKMIDGPGRLYTICHQAESIFGTVSKKSGMMEELCNDRARLQDKRTELRMFLIVHEHSVPTSERKPPVKKELSYSELSNVEGLAGWSMFGTEVPKESKKSEVLEENDNTCSSSVSSDY